MRDEVPDRGQRGGAHHEHLSPVVGAAHQGDRAAPAAHRLDVGVEGRAAQQRIGIQQQARGVPSGRGGLRARGRHDDRAVRDGVVLERAVGAAGDLERGVREGAVELLGGAGGADHHRPHLGAIAFGAAVGVLPATADPAVQRAVAPRERQRSGAVRALGAGAAEGAGDRGHVPGAGHLHQHRSSGQAAADHPHRLLRDPGAARGALALAQVLVHRDDARAH